MTNLPNCLRLYFDGACEPCNPGGVATYGYIVMNDDEIVHKACGVAVAGGPGSTNNVAEYSALGFGLRWLADQGWNGKLNILGDSKLVVSQISLSWACNKAHLQRLRDRCLELLDKICPGKSYKLQWIPREANAAADALSRAAYEKHTGKTFPERRPKHART